MREQGIRDGREQQGSGHMTEVAAAGTAAGAVGVGVGVDVGSAVDGEDWECKNWMNWRKSVEVQMARILDEGKTLVVTSAVAVVAVVAVVTCHCQLH